MCSFWTFTPKMKTNDLITTIFRLMDEHFFKKNALYWQNLFSVDEIVWRQDYKRKNNKIEWVYFFDFFLLGVFIFRLKRLEDHQERNKCKFPRLCPGGGIMHNHITPGVGVEVLQGVLNFQWTFKSVKKILWCEHWNKRPRRRYFHI